LRETKEEEEEMKRDIRSVRKAKERVAEATVRRTEKSPPEKTKYVMTMKTRYTPQSLRG
jgi:hypothetical protein